MPKWSAFVCVLSFVLNTSAFAKSSPTWSDCELGRRNPDRSIVACTQVLERGPASCRAEAFHNRGTAYAAKGDLDHAISDVSEGIRRDPRQAYRFQERGELYLKKEDFKRALADLNEAIRIDPTRAFRFNFRAYAYLGTGDLPRAIADFNEAIRLDPIKRAFRFHGRANALSAAVQYDRAISDYDEALRLEPTDGWVLVDRGRAYAKTGQIASAKRDFEAAQNVPDASPELRVAAANEIAVLFPTPSVETPASPPGPPPARQATPDVFPAPPVGPALPTQASPSPPPPILPAGVRVRARDWEQCLHERTGAS